MKRSTDELRCFVVVLCHDMARHVWQILGMAMCPRFFGKWAFVSGLPPPSPLDWTAVSGLRIWRAVDWTVQPDCGPTPGLDCWTGAWRETTFPCNVEIHACTFQQNNGGVYVSGF